MDALTRVRCPRLEKLDIEICCDGYRFISRFAELVKEDTCALPNLREFSCDCVEQEEPVHAIEALFKLLSCPCMAALESLSIFRADIADEANGLLCKIATACPKLKHLDLRHNFLGRPAAAMMLGVGQFMGAWPELEQLGGFVKVGRAEVAESDDLYAESLVGMDIKATFRRVWPGLICF